MSYKQGLKRYVSLVIVSESRHFEDNALKTSLYLFSSPYLKKLTCLQRK